MHSDVHISSSLNLKPVFEARRGFFFASQPFIFVSKSKRNIAGRQKAAGLNTEMKEQAEEERSPGRQFERTLAEEEKKKQETRPEQVAEEENELEDLNL